jgi:sigma-B regulation protein RsbU (phosphoserine phosphatase)
VLYTDGLTEARTHAGEEFGEDGLQSFLAGHTGCRAAELTDRIGALLDRFDPDRADDVAVLALTVPPDPGRTGGPPPARATTIRDAATDGKEEDR